jgi:hypothetical protein
MAARPTQPAPRPREAPSNPAPAPEPLAEGPAGISPLKVLVLLLIIDIGIGVWLKLHNPAALPLFVVVNAPTVGVTGFFWPLLPKDAKDRIGEGIAAALTAPLTSKILLGLGGTLFLASLAVSSVTVTLLDSDTSTTLHVVRGTQTEPDSQAVRGAPQIRLSRLTSPQSELLWIRPTGQRVWLYSPTHVLLRDTTLVPWIPVHLQYPQDFRPMAAVAVLPQSEILMQLTQDSLRLTLREDGGGEALASYDLKPYGTVISYLEPEPRGAEDSTRWKAWLVQQADSAREEFISVMLRRWLGGSWVKASRPLREGETVSWDVRRKDDSTRTVAKGRLTLNAPLADLYLGF